MTQRQRFNNDPGGEPAGDNNPAAATALPEFRSAADRLLAAGDEAIRRALASGNSQAFLEASRQQGGQ
jgi:hypothetical protein